MKLRQYYKGLPEDKRALAYKLCDRAEFMEKTLKELEARVNKDGAVITSTNGNGFQVVQEHPAQKSYNTMMNRYSTTITKLYEMLPSGMEVDDEFTEWIKEK